MNLLKVLPGAFCLTAFVLGAVDVSFIGDAKRWDAYECKVAPATEQFANTPTMLLDIPVDHFAGEKKYPIGWPRMYSKKITAEEGNWSGAKALEFKVYTEFTGAERKGYPISISIATAKNEKYAVQGMAGLKNKETVTVRIPLDKVPDLDKVVRVGFSISESQYKHSDNLKLRMGDFKLVK